MPRRLRTIFPLVVIVGFALLYVRSFSRADTLFLPSTHSTILAVASADGRLFIQTYDDPHRFINRGRWFSLDTATPGYEFLLTLSPRFDEFHPISEFSFFPIAWLKGPATIPTSPRPVYSHLTFPHWLCILLLAPFPLLALSKTLRTRRRLSHQLCPNCHYDLRAHHQSPLPPRCPECGTPISSS